MLIKLIKFWCENCANSKLHEVQLGVGVCHSCQVANWVPSECFKRGSIKLQYLGKDEASERLWCVTSDTADIDQATVKDLYSWGVTPRKETNVVHEEEKEEVQWVG